MSNSKLNWDPDDWMGRCAWCGRRIPADHEVFGVSMKCLPGMVRAEWAGTVQPLQLVTRGKTLPMIVVSEDSPAKRDGVDAVFQMCSDRCGRELQAALGQEFDPGAARFEPGHDN